MTQRSAVIERFVRNAGWEKARIVPLAGDASNRRYLRLMRATGPGTAVLMDAPPHKGEDIRPFVRIAHYLIGQNFSAPRILAQDTAHGLLLLEDLGDDLFARVLNQQPGREIGLYSCATDLLVDLHRKPPPRDLAPYSVDLMSDLAALAFDWYLAVARAPDDVARSRFLEEMQTALSRHAPRQPVLIQRDYHSENLLWLPDRDGVARVGLLDFQDAMLGHPAYDLVSLLQDARRDVSPQTEAAMIARYVAASRQDGDVFDTAYHVLGAQRNLRILGVFARLCVRDGKAGYVDLIPRVWELLMRDLSHPELSGLCATIIGHLPYPTDTIISRLKSQCATFQDP